MYFHDSTIRSISIDSMQGSRQKWPRYPHILYALFETSESQLSRTFRNYIMLSKFCDYYLLPSENGKDRNSIQLKMSDFGEAVSQKWLKVLGKYKTVHKCKIMMDCTKKKNPCFRKVK